MAKWEDLRMKVNFDEASTTQYGWETLYGTLADFSADVYRPILSPMDFVPRPDDLTARAGTWQVHYLQSLITQVPVDCNRLGRFPAGLWSRCRIFRCLADIMLCMDSKTGLKPEKTPMDISRGIHQPYVVNYIDQTTNITYNLQGTRFGTDH